jgi:hypothetical protein
MTELLVAVGNALAVTLELVEATAIVLAVRLSRRWRDATLGALAAVAVYAAAVGADLGQDALRAAALDAHNRAEQLNGRFKGRSCSSIMPVSRSICWSRKSMCARIAPIHSRWCSSE